MHLRTIFDFDMEACERKPWRHQGVDKTDFFNFGFDVESWKCYRYSMVKAYENLPTNGMVGEVHCFDPGEKNQVVLNNLERVGIEFDLVC
ncbi:putative pre-mRNA polyadenylation factor Fip1 domain-containing protein [Dioscorea sansibarensis]